MLQPGHLTRKQARFAKEVQHQSARTLPPVRQARILQLKMQRSLAGSQAVCYGVR